VVIDRRAGILAVGVPHREAARPTDTTNMAIAKLARGLLHHLREHDILTAVSR
jgi:hypothetical protein